MPTDDVTAAAERLRANKDRRRCFPLSDSLPVEKQEHADLLAIRDWALPLLDPTPVTEGWLRSVGWSFDSIDDETTAAWLVVDEDRRLEMYIVTEPIALTKIDRMTFEWDTLCQFAPHPTRGKIRQLHALFGIPILEPAHAR